MSRNKDKHGFNVGDRNQLWVIQSYNPLGDNWIDRISNPDYEYMREYFKEYYLDKEEGYRLVVRTDEVNAISKIES